MVEAARSNTAPIIVIDSIPQTTPAELLEKVMMSEMVKEKREKFLIEIPFRDMMEPRLGPSTFRKASAPFAQFAKEPSRKQRNRRHI